MEFDLESRFNKIIVKIKEPAVVKKFNPYISWAKTAGPILPDWIPGQTLYEVYPRGFSDAGNFENVRINFKRFQDLGIGFIWLMPVYPIGEEGRKGDLGSPYAVKEYFKVNPEYGNKNDLKKLVDEAHKLGFKVLVDMVANHVASDYSELKNNPKLVKRDKKGQPVRKVADWTDIADLDYKNTSTREHMHKVITYWLKEFNLDGYRCDVAGMVPPDFWESVFPDLQKINPNVYMLAEWDGSYMHEKVFHSTYDWVMYELMKDVFDGKESAFILLEWQEIHKKTYPKNALPLRFLENHDLPRATKTFGKKGLIPFLTFIFSINGLPLIYTGQETGTSDYLSLFDKDSVNWNDQDNYIYGIYKHLISLRKKIPAMYSPEVKICIHNQIPDILIYEKTDGKSKIFVLLNVRDKEIKVRPHKNVIERLIAAKVLFNSEDVLPLKKENLILKPYQSIIYSTH